jgi:hypothetical protein
LTETRLFFARSPGHLDATLDLVGTEVHEAEATSRAEASLLNSATRCSRRPSRDSRCAPNLGVAWAGDAACIGVSWENEENEMSMVAMAHASFSRRLNTRLSSPHSWSPQLSAVAK